MLKKNKHSIFWLLTGHKCEHLKLVKMRILADLHLFCLYYYFLSLFFLFFFFFFFGVCVCVCVCVCVFWLFICLFVTCCFLLISNFLLLTGQKCELLTLVKMCIMTSLSCFFFFLVCFFGCFLYLILLGVGMFCLFFAFACFLLDTDLFVLFLFLLVFLWGTVFSHGIIFVVPGYDMITMLIFCQILYAIWDNDRQISYPVEIFYDLTLSVFEHSWLVPEFLHCMS